MSGKNNSVALQEINAKANTDMEQKPGSNIEAAGNAKADGAAREIKIDETVSDKTNTDRSSTARADPVESRSKPALSKNTDTDPSDSSSESEPEPWTAIKKTQAISHKVTLGNNKVAKKGKIGVRKVGDPGVALIRTNPKLVNFKNTTEAERMWWEQTEVFAHRWGGPVTKGKGNDAWATIHLPKVHWKTRKALEERKKKEAEEEKALVGAKDGGDEGETKKKVTKVAAKKQRRG